MGFLDSLFGWGGEDPEAIRQREEGYRRQAEDRARQQDEAALKMQYSYLDQLRADQAAKDAAFAAKDPTATREGAMNTIGAYFTPEFEQGWVGAGVTDPYEQEAFASQRSTADEYLNRLLKRGVISDTGYATGQKALGDQDARVRQQLADLGDVLVNAERDKLGGYAGRARSAASALGKDQPFDVNPYFSGAQTELGSFTSGLSDLYKSQVPDNLFDTSALLNAAGAAQGAGNRPFDPDIQPDKYASTDETDPFEGQKPVQKRTSTVF